MNSKQHFDFSFVGCSTCTQAHREQRVLRVSNTRIEDEKPADAAVASRGLKFAMIISRSSIEQNASGSGSAAAAFATLICLTPPRLAKRLGSANWFCGMQHEQRKQMSEICIRITEARRVSHRESGCAVFLQSYRTLMIVCSLTILPFQPRSCIVVCIRRTISMRSSIEELELKEQEASTIRSAHTASCTLCMPIVCFSLRIDNQSTSSV